MKNFIIACLLVFCSFSCDHDDEDDSNSNPVNLETEQSTESNPLTMTMASGIYRELCNNSSRILIERYRALGGGNPTDVMISWEFNFEEKKIIRTVIYFESKNSTCTNPTDKYIGYYDINDTPIWDNDSFFFKLTFKPTKSSIILLNNDIVTSYNSNISYGFDNWVLNQEKEVTGTNSDGSTYILADKIYLVVSPLIGKRIYLNSSQDNYPDHVDGLEEYIKK